MLGRYPVSLAKVLALLFSLTLTACGGGGGGSDSGGSVTPDVSFGGSVVDQETGTSLQGVELELPLGPKVYFGATNDAGTFQIIVPGADIAALGSDFEPAGVVVTGVKTGYTTFSGTYKKADENPANVFTLSAPGEMRELGDADVVLSPLAPANFAEGSGNFIRLGDGISSGVASDKLQSSILHGSSASYAIELNDVQVAINGGVTEFLVGFQVLGLDNGGLTKVTLQELDGAGQPVVGSFVSRAIPDTDLETWVSFEGVDAFVFSYAEFDAPPVGRRFTLTFSTSPTDGLPLETEPPREAGTDYLDDSEISFIAVQVN
jgi:hypothetical protein